MEKVSDGLLGNEKLDLLMDLTGRINSNIDLDSLLLDIIKAAQILTGSEASSLFLLDENNDELVLSIPTGPATEKISGKRIPKDKGIAGWVVENKKSVIVNDAQEDSRFWGDFHPDLFKTENLMGVPMMNRSKEVIGVLEAINHHNGRGFNEDDLTFFQVLANQAAISIEKAQLQEERQKKKLLEQKLDLAQSIQKGFLPEKAPSIEGYDIAGTTRPAAKVGGDYYDFILGKDSGKYGFTVGDVTGKGIPAALLMASVRSVLRTQVENRYPPAKTLNLVNRAIYKDTPIDKFITLFYGDLDHGTHEFTYVNAGHTETFLVDFKNREIQSLNKGGVMLGIKEQVDYNQQTIRLKPGQQLVMYSDGITESQNDSGEFFGKEKFRQWLLKHPEASSSETIALLLREIERFRNTKEQSDDITLIVIQREED